ncbi:MAG: protein phosphatase 2C domain-containing protein, partial [Anaerolineaceae bacterium]|nr:protein phosphatase 2C domain-containing protein [Anaerolineaceae bacterium]
MNRIEKSHINSIALSHPGMTGKNNEDRFGVSAFSLSDEAATPVLLAVLADGIGGHRAGEVASEMVIDIVSLHVSASDGKAPVDTLREAIQAASQEIHTKSEVETGRKGMGATVACAWISGDRLYTATVGDSRIYFMREGKIRQISKDHSWIQEAIDTGILTPEQAVGHPNAHVIRRYVGSPQPPEVDSRLYLDDHESDEQALAHQGIRLQSGDKLLLCSDGLSDLVEADEILNTLEQNSLEDATQKLIDLANERGGHDNITIISLKIPEGSFTKKEKEALPWRTITFGCLGVVAVILIAIAAFFGYKWFTEREQVTPTIPAIMTSIPTETTTEQAVPTESLTPAVVHPTETFQIKT